MPIRTLLITAVAAVLTACTLGPDFRPPAVPAAVAYRAATQAGAPGPAPGTPRPVFGGEPQQRWWSLFGSVALDQLVDQAVAGNPGLQSAQATLAQAGDLAMAADGRRYPEVDLDAGAGRQKYGAQFLGPLKLPPFTAYGVGPTVRYLLDYDGAIRRSSEEAGALVQYRRSRLDATYLALTGDVVLQAIHIAATRSRLQAAQQLVAADAEDLRLVRGAMAAGAVSRVELAATLARQSADGALLPPLQQRLSEARHRLAVLCGQAPAVEPPADFELARLRLPSSIPVHLPSSLVHRRPDILSAEARLHAATAAVGVATADLYPRIELTAGLSQQATRLGGLFDGAGTAWGVLAGLSAPVFDGGMRHAAQRAAIDALHARAADYRQTVLAAFGQVADLLDALDHDARLVEARTGAVGAAADSLALVRASRSAGETGLLPLLEARRRRQLAELDLLQARGRQYEDVAQLLLAMGGGMPPQRP